MVRILGDGTDTPWLTSTLSPAAALTQDELNPQSLLLRVLGAVMTMWLLSTAESV